MPKVIVLSDKKVETLFNTKDFEYLIDRYMGFDAVNHFRGIIREYEEGIEELKTQIKDMGGSVDSDD